MVAVFVIHKIEIMKRFLIPNKFLRFQSSSSHSEGTRILSPLNERLAVLQTIWILSATTTSHSNETRHLLLDAIRSADISPETLVGVVNSQECEQILHAQRHIDNSCWHDGHQLDANEVIGHFLDTLTLVGERSPANEISGQSGQASSPSHSQSALSQTDEHGNEETSNDEAISQQQLQNCY